MRSEWLARQTHVEAYIGTLRSAHEVAPGRMRIYSRAGTLPPFFATWIHSFRLSAWQAYGVAMKRYFALGAGLLWSTVIGAAAVTGLHAQAKPSIFVITEIDISDPEGYGNEFIPKAQAIKAAGFKF